MAQARSTMIIARFAAQFIANWWKVLIEMRDERRWAQMFCYICLTTEKNSKLNLIFSIRQKEFEILIKNVK